MNSPTLNSVESQFFNSLNQLVSPLLRAGVGFPCFAPVGAILLETTGRRSGRKIKIPVLATRLGRLLLVSTVRSRSPWMKNLAATPEVRYWLGGREIKAQAFVFLPTANQVPEDLPHEVGCLAKILMPHSKIFGVSFAVLLSKSARATPPWQAVNPQH